MKPELVQTEMIITQTPQLHVAMQQLNIISSNNSTTAINCDSKNNITPKQYNNNTNFSSSSDESESNVATSLRFKPVSNEMAVQLQKKFNDLKHFDRIASKSVVGCNGSLTYKDLALLKAGTYISGSIISYYSQLLLVKAMNKKSTILSRKYITDTTFYQNLISINNEYKYDNVCNTFFDNGKHSRRTRKQINIFEQYDDILIPVGKHTHWYVIHVNIRQKVVNVYDSFQSLSNSKQTGLDFIKNILKWLNDEHMARFNGKKIDNKKWKEVLYNKCPQQQNGFDCGIYACIFLDFTFHDESIKINSVTPTDATNFRLKIAEAILKGCLDH
jgi:Ulp1 family protease